MRECSSSASRRPTLSHHFKVLRESGVVRTRPEGRKRLLSLRTDDLDARFPGLLDAVLAAKRAPGALGGLGAPLRDAPGRTRTSNPALKRRSLYQLSYGGSGWILAGLGPPVPCVVEERSPYTRALLSHPSAAICP